MRLLEFTDPGPSLERFSPARPEEIIQWMYVHNIAALGVGAQHLSGSRGWSTRKKT